MFSKGKYGLTMYAKYQSLFGGCGITNATTDSTRFSCISLAQQPLVRRSIQSRDSSPSDVRCLHGDCPPPPEVCRYKRCASPPTRRVVEGFYLAPPGDNKTPISKVLIPVTVKRDHDNTFRKDPASLLPVLDPVFNMREICKQCILLEDHLSHTEKRCTDCCIKHFLTIEALAEEAITLDKNSKLQILDLPRRVRDLQRKWYESPEKNAHEVSQKLREIRKQFQIGCFDVIFRDEGCNTCQDGVCPVKKTK